MKKLFEKYAIVRYIVISFIKTLLIALLALAVLFAILVFTGIYAQIETALDLKYDSPFVLVPLWGFGGLAVFCFLIGFLMCFYKYKRTKSQSAFYAALSRVLNEK